MSDGVQPPKIEGILDIELLACRTCRRVELRVPQQR
jgi:hypothetical protein